MITAEEYAALPDMGTPTELVRGRVVPLVIPAPRYGQVCSTLLCLAGNHVERHDLGQVLARSGVITQRDPDTVRGADASFYSYSRVPRGPLPPGYLDVVPELVFEVRSPRDRWPRLLAKASEYLEAGVTVVCLLDEVSERVLVCRSEDLPLTLHGDDELHLPDVLGDFRVPVRRFFE